MIKVMICDDQALIRDGLELLLKLDREIEVVDCQNNCACRPRKDYLVLSIRGFCVHRAQFLHERFPEDRFPEGVDEQTQHQVIKPICPIHS